MPGSTRIHGEVFFSTEGSPYFHFLGNEHGNYNAQVKEDEMGGACSTNGEEAESM
jgi:hypothetical protein